MNYAVYNIALDIHKTGSQVALSMIRGENKRQINISLTENGRPYKLDDGCTAYFAAKTPKGGFIHDTCDMDLENNQIVYHVTSDSLADYGEAKCQIELTGIDGGLLYSPTFSLIVADRLYNNEPVYEASEEFKSLAKFLTELKQKLANGEFKGDQGDKGDKGDQGPQGPQGIQGESGKDGIDGKDADVSSLSPAIVCTSTGTAITISDSSESGFEAFSIYGKSTQNGTPTPIAPVDIVSVGDDGSVGIKIIGKNHINITDKTIDGFTIKNIGTKILISGTNPNTYAMRVKLCDVKLYANIQYCLSGGLTTDNMIIVSETMDTFEITSAGASGTFTPTKNMTMGVYLRVNPGQILNNHALYPQLEVGRIATEYEPYSEQTIATAKQLKGVPITDKSLSTYIDVNGQMFASDEIDLEKGVYIQKIAKYVCTGNEEWTVSPNQLIQDAIRYDGVAVVNNGGARVYDVMCSHFQYKGANQIGVWLNPMESTEIYMRIMVSKSVFADSNSLITFLKAQYANGTPVTFYYYLIRPISTPLSNDTIAAYKALKTNYPSTTILNDENAFMKVGYRADTKKFIERMAGSTTQISSVALAASKWAGTASPYSQVVTIPGTTKNSKIDLNPTVDQLNIFHTKDISFVVGNNSGTITVYCIGQKPTNDYTMQVTITEVAKNG